MVGPQPTGSERTIEEDWIPLTQDSNASQMGTFVADLPNGTYDVTVTIGDVVGVSDNLSVSLEGEEAGQISAAAGEHTSGNYRVEVSDGQLTIDLKDLGGDSRYFYLNAIHVQSAGAPPADLTGPQVVSATPINSQSNSLDGFRITFSEAIPDGGLQLSYLTATGPNGSIQPSGLTRISATEFEVDVPTQTAAGLYTLTVSPQVTDVAGNLMDQDGDGIGRRTGGRSVPGHRPVVRVAGVSSRLRFWHRGLAGGRWLYAGRLPTPNMLPRSAMVGPSAYWTGANDRGGSDPLTEDANVSQMGTFAVDLPNGTYDVTITIGDAVGSLG